MKIGRFTTHSLRAESASNMAKRKQSGVAARWQSVRSPIGLCRFEPCRSTVWFSLSFNMLKTHLYEIKENEISRIWTNIFPILRRTFCHLAKWPRCVDWALQGYAKSVFCPPWEQWNTTKCVLHQLVECMKCQQLLCPVCDGWRVADTRRFSEVLTWESFKFHKFHKFQKFLKFSRNFHIEI